MLNERRRRAPALARGGGRRHRVRHPRRRDPADVRRARARHLDPARARPPRAGRGPHGPGLRARLGPRRRRVRHLRPGGDEPGHADRRRLDGLDAARLRDGAGAIAADRHRRLPGVRHHRDHDPDRQALVARPGRGRAFRTRSRPRSTSPARGVAAPSSWTSRATSRRRSSTSATRTRSICPAGGPPRA